MCSPNKVCFGITYKIGEKINSENEAKNHSSGPLIVFRFASGLPVLLAQCTSVQAGRPSNEIAVKCLIQTYNFVAIIRFDHRITVTINEKKQTILSDSQGFLKYIPVIYLI